MRIRYCDLSIDLFVIESDCGSGRQQMKIQDSDSVITRESSMVQEDAMDPVTRILNFGVRNQTYLTIHEEIYPALDYTSKSTSSSPPRDKSS